MDDARKMAGSMPPSRHISRANSKGEFSRRHSVKDVEAQISRISASTAMPKILSTPISTMKKHVYKSIGSLLYEPPAVLTVRRTIAEDHKWSLETVPMLSDICIQNIVNNFTDNPVLDELNVKQKVQLLENLPTNLPMKVSAPLISDETYWKRCCKARWQICDVADYENSWKRMYFERNLQDIIENFVPGSTDLSRIQEALLFSKNFIHRLDIRQLLPPVKITLKTSSKNSSDGAKIKELDNLLDDESVTDHFDFNLVIPDLINFEELQLTYGVKNCGMNFEWNMFQFTMHDCISLANCIKNCKSIKVFRLQSSRVDDEKIRVLMGQLLNHPSLTELDFAHNIIKDRGAKAIGRFLCGGGIVNTLNLCNNSIGTPGASGLSFSLTVNNTVQTLNLRLNRIEDEGCQALCQALLGNTTLTNVNIASNGLTGASLVMLSQVMVYNNTLKILDLSCNSFDIESGKTFSEALDGNLTLVSIDMRLTNCGQEVEYCIMRSLKRNERLEVQMKGEPRNSTTS